MSQVSATRHRRGAAPCAPALTAGSCLFLDVDGTLLDFAPTPAEVQVDPGLIGLLEALLRKLQGGVALVSGRPIDELDRLFAPLRMPSAGIHGVEWRNPPQTIRRGTTEQQSLDGMRHQLGAVVDLHPGLLLEDKGSALAVHFRRVPEAAELVRRVVAAAAAQLSPDFELQEGDMVLEIKPAFYSKGRAVDAFMREPPFAGRTPLFVGDDYTDLDGFAAVMRHGGMAIAVGERIVSPWRIKDPASVRHWLTSFVGAESG